MSRKTELRTLHVEFENIIQQFVENKKADAYNNNTFEGVIEAYFWLYIRSVLHSKTPHFLTFIHQAYWGDKKARENLPEDVKKALDEAFSPRPKKTNRGIDDGKTYWDYSDVGPESDSLINGDD